MEFERIYSILLKKLKHRRPYDTDEILAEEMATLILEMLEGEEDDDETDSWD